MKFLGRLAHGSVILLDEVPAHLILWEIFRVGAGIGVRRDGCIRGIWLGGGRVVVGAVGRHDRSSVAC